MPTSLIQQIYSSSTTESALQILRQSDQLQGSNWVDQIYQNIATQIDLRSQDYIRKHSEQEVRVGSLLFDRQRNIIQMSKNAEDLITKLC